MNLEGKIDLIKQAVQAIKEAIQQKIEDYTGLPYTIQGNLSTYATEIDNNIVIPNNQTKTVTSNGTVTYDVGYTGLESVMVNVNQSVQNKTITDNGTYTADSGYVGLGTVSVNVQPDLDTKVITANGNYNASEDDLDGYSSVTVNVQPDLDTKIITANGTYLASDDDLDGYSSVTVNVVSPQFNCLVRNNILENLEDINGNILPLSATSIQNGLDFGQKYSDDTTVSAVYLNKLTTIDKFYETFMNCANLASVDLSNLTTINSQMALERTFDSCAKLISVDLSSLTTVNGKYAMYMAFSNCRKLKNIDLSNLITINGEQAMVQVFKNCFDINDITFSSLTTIEGKFALSESFKASGINTLSFPSLTSNSFGSYTNQFNNMLKDVSGCIVHFPSNLQSVIGSWSDVISGFGGDNTVVLFDLPTTT